MRNKFITTLVAFGLVGQVLCKKTTKTANRASPWELVLQEMVRGDSVLTATTEVKFYNASGGQPLLVRVEEDADWGTKYKYFLEYVNPQGKHRRDLRLRVPDLKKIAKKINFNCPDEKNPSEVYSFAFTGDDCQVRVTKTYGFSGMGSDSAKIPVRLYVCDDNYKGFYFDSGLRLKLDSKMYDILNIKTTGNGPNFEFSKTQGIQMAIYSSTAPGTPPSLIAVDAEQFCLVYVNKTGAEKFNKTHKFTLVPLEGDDIDNLAKVSQGILPETTLKKGYKVSTTTTWGLKYLVVTPGIPTE